LQELLSDSPYTVGVDALIVEAVVDAAGRIVLDNLPFVPGEKVDVILRPHTETRPIDLIGSVLRFDRPFEPVAPDDWEQAS
jgi:hypothetical protein